jgi:hypothetical protein
MYTVFRSITPINELTDDTLNYKSPCGGVARRSNDKRPYRANEITIQWTR